MKIKTIISAVVGILLQLLKVFNRQAANKQTEKDVGRGRDDYELDAHRKANDVSDAISSAHERVRKEHPATNKYNRRRKSGPLS